MGRKRHRLHLVKRLIIILFKGKFIGFCASGLLNQEFLGFQSVAIDNLFCKINVFMILERLEHQCLIHIVLFDNQVIFHRNITGQRLKIPCQDSVRSVSSRCPCAG